MEKIGENSNIEEISKINEQNIDPANYFMTLTSEAAAVGILSEGEIAYMQSQIADIIADNIWQYNSGESTSVTNEIAADLIESIVFALDCFCISVVKSDNGGLINEKCVEMLREKAGIKNCYLKGLEYISRLVNYNKNLYNELYINKLKIGIALYNSAINKSLAIFFKNYNMRLFTHRINISEPVSFFFDYMPALSSEIKNYKGILYVNEYIRYLLMENEFCSLFEIKDVQRLMKLYADNNGFYVNELMENIFEKVFTNAFFSTIADSNKVNLFINRRQYIKISENFYDNGNCRDDIFIYELINDYAQRLLLNLKINNPELQKYIFKYQNKFAENILPAIQNNYLQNLITYDD